MNAYRFNVKLALFLIVGITIVVSLYGCTGNSRSIEGTSTNSVPVTNEAIQSPMAEFTPKPTFVTVPTTVGTSTAISARPTSTLDCINALQFVTDLTIPDGALIARGAQVDKRWQIKNTGTCNWDRRYSLVLISGTELGIAKKQALNPARSGSQAVIRMILTAPMSPGIYTSVWQAFGPDGEPFGDVIYLQIQVN